MDADTVALVTGGTGTVGSEVVRGLAARADRVVFVGRDAERGERLAAEATRETPGTARFVPADLSERAGVREVADAVRADGDGRLDRFVHAAGTFRPDRRLTEEGVEYTLAVNYLAAYRLCHDLLDLLAAAPAATVVAVTAAVGDRDDIAFDNLDGSREYSLSSAYARSKRCLTAFAREFAVRADGVTVRAVHPGFVPGARATDALPWAARASYRALDALSLGDSPATAAERVLDHAVDPPEGPTYVEGDEFVDLPAWAADAAVRERLWTESARLAGVDPDWPAR
jgi:NAD(P)-dependent dehydrogenase (short-subunit alcohol dehydrogenase family)